MHSSARPMATYVPPIDGKHAMDRADAQVWYRKRYGRVEAFVNYSLRHAGVFLLVLALGLTVMGCAGRIAAHKPRVVLVEPFELDQCCPGRYPTSWQVEATGPAGAVYTDTGETGRGIRLIAGGQEVRLRRVLDPRSHQGRRLVASVRARVTSTKAAGRVVVRILTSRPGHSLNAWESAESES